MCRSAGASLQADGGREQLESGEVGVFWAIVLYSLYAIPKIYAQQT